MLILCHGIIKKYNIPKNNIVGHSDIAPRRKNDPGEKFPWKYLSSQGIGIYPTKVSNKQSNYPKLQIKRFLKNLHKIGYRYLNNDARKIFWQKYQANSLTSYKNSLDFDSEILEFIKKL